MNYLLKSVRPIMAIVGGFLIYGGIGTIDYYVYELGQTEPASAWSTITIGAFMLLPALFYTIRKEYEERRR